MKRTIAVAKKELGPVGKAIYCWISRKISLSWDLFRPIIRATKQGFASLIAAL
jgi:hypothetical protein